MCAMMRMIWVALCLASKSCWMDNNGYDVVLVDQVSIVVPLFKWLLNVTGKTKHGRTSVVFYCHFPDMLLATRTTCLRRAYRAPFDMLEEATTGAADAVLVNSMFTSNVFGKTFRKLHRAGLRPGVLYPAVDVDAHSITEKEVQDVSILPRELRCTEDVLMLSINRFERKKGLDLAILALAEYMRRKREDGSVVEGGGGPPTVRLCLAGGYDKAVLENVEHLQELTTLAETLGVREFVSFVPNFSSDQRRILLARCRAVIYTPENEHFGIVPLEAMAASRPVIACASGGPTETVVHLRTGYLCPPTPGAFADALETLVEECDLAVDMGKMARERVVQKFSRDAFGEKLEKALRESTKM